MAGLTNPLPRLNKLMYAAEMVGSQAVSQTRTLWLLFFLAPPRDENLPVLVPGLNWGPIDLDPRVFIGGLLAAGRIIEALDDPLIGWLSDRTKSRWGRRLPFLVLSTPFYGVLFFFLWFTPAGEASMANAIYIFIVLELFFLASTLGAGPYEALLPEIARSHRERVSVVAWQFYFGVLGAALGLSLSGLIQDAFGFKVMGAVMAVAAVSFRYLATGGIWRHAPRDTPPARTSFGEAFKATLRNVQFLYFIPTFLFFNLAVNMVIAWLPFFSSALISSESSGSSTAAITFTALVSMTISAFVLWKLCNSLGKARIYSACLLGTALVFPLLFFTGMAPGVPTLYQALFIAVLAGFPMAGVNLLPRAITADITDYDEIRTGMRREGMFFAVQNLFEKAGSSLAPFLLALILLLGETAEDPWGIRLLGPAAGLIAFLGFWLFRGYRLPSTVTRETLKAAGLDAGPEEPERSQEDQRP